MALLSRELTPTNIWLGRVKQFITERSLNLNAVQIISYLVVTVKHLAVSEHAYTEKICKAAELGIQAEGAHLHVKICSYLSHTCYMLHSCKVTLLPL